jgi:hypothetical protein
MAVCSEIVVSGCGVEMQNRYVFLSHIPRSQVLLGNAYPDAPRQNGEVKGYLHFKPQRRSQSVGAIAERKIL